MNTTEADLLKELLGLELSEDKMKVFEKYKTCFLSKNAYTNLISKNDEKFLFEKHIFDSLAINKFFEASKRKKSGRLLDIGTGGGFPSVPVAIAYDELNVFAVDSIRKKIDIIESIKSELELANLVTICDRVEKIMSNGEVEPFDYITTRAVAPMDVILKYALPNLKSDGCFVAYKSKKAQEELDAAKRTLKNFNAKVCDIIEYQLPLEEVYERCLIVVKKSKG